MSNIDHSLLKRQFQKELSKAYDEKVQPSYVQLIRSMDTIVAQMEAMLEELEVMAGAVEDLYGS